MNNKDITIGSSAGPTGQRESLAPEALAALAKRNLTDTFEVERALGAGAMGRVDAARERTLGRRVAVKSLQHAMKREPAAIARFITEAQVTAQLEHPNIVPIYGLESDDGAPAFTMRLLPGKSLDDLIARAREAVTAGQMQERLALPARFEIFLAVCNALSYAHARGVVHRDLKPENIVLGEHGDVYVVDWGIAKVLGAPELPALVEPRSETLRVGSEPPISSRNSKVNISSASGTRQGELIGTLSHMPPEQALGTLNATGPASDQFALGLMLQELISLRPARDGSSEMALLSLALTAGRAPFATTGEGRAVPPELEAIVARATQTAPEQRYPDVDALAADVRRYARGDAVSVLPDSAARKLVRSLQKRPAAFAASAALLVAVAALGICFGLWRSLAARERAIAQSASLSTLANTVHARSRSIDSRFADVRALTEGLGAAIEVMLTANTHASDHGSTISGWGAAGRLTREGPAIADRAMNARYGMPVSFTTPAFVYPASVLKSDVQSAWSHLDALRALFPETMARSGEPAAARWTDAETRAYLNRARPAIHVIYVGLENGLLLNYPGYEPFPDAYDARRRPWYEAAATRAGTAFGVPYPDASGSAVLVPCNRSLRDRKGNLVGVAGADMALDDVAAEIAFAKVAGWRRTELVNGEGEVVLDTNQAGLRLGVDLHDDAPLARRLLEPALVRDIQQDSGWTRHGDELVVFERLGQIPWTLVVHFDARTWLLH
jgi:eukaryotic-like serine/threonine-protein kinase